MCGSLSSASPANLTGVAAQSTHLDRQNNPDQVVLVIRNDDAGMSYRVNTGLERLIASGLPVSSPVMFPTSRPHNIKLLNYRQIIAMQGLPFMRRPAD